jgi:DNA repair exonuclease SbcCD ATPase subunit
MRSNVKNMKTKYFPVFVLFLTVTVLVPGCGKTDANLASENADLKARVQQLEQQLKASGTPVASSGAESASLQDLRNQLAEAQKKAEAAANDLKSVSSQLDAQKQKIDELTRELSNAQQARDKAEKALQLYRDNASSALKQFQALRSTLGDQTLKLDGYQQNYQATRTAVTTLVNALPESQVRRAISGVQAAFKQIDDTCETAAQQMETRSKTAQANYDKFIQFGGLGPNDYVIQMGKDKILAPAEKDNAATASRRDEQVIFLKKDLDVALKNLQALLSGPGA